tara:strand:- start:9962 stop:10276 length:315 start_codon:yes stop_codon:yes gene_type:complete
MPIDILELVCSPKPYKRFRIKIQEGDKQKHFDFGLKGGETYIDHEDKIKRRNYLARHLANKSEKQLIENNIPSPALFSAVLLWGKNTDLCMNLVDLQKAFNSNK